MTEPQVGWTARVEETFQALRWADRDAQELACQSIEDDGSAAKLRELFEADRAKLSERAAAITAVIEKPAAIEESVEKPKIEIVRAKAAAESIKGRFLRILVKEKEAKEKVEVAEKKVGVGVVVALKPREQEKPEPEPVEAELDWNGLLDRDAPLDSARKLVGLRYWHRAALVPMLRLWQGQFWEWKGKNWRVIDDNTMRNRVYHFLDGAQVQAKGYRARFEPTSYDVNRVMDALKAETNLEPDKGMPGWLLGEAPVGNLRELIAVRNGLLHVRTRRLMAHTPRFWSPNVLEFEYDPKAKAPRFEQFLEEIFPRDDEAQEALLEMIGLCLTDETKYQKAFMFIGPRRGGRGTIGRLLRGLVGEENYVGSMLRGMARQFGMQSWIGKKVALFPDVRTDGIGIDRLSTVSETLLGVTGEDARDIDRKYLAPWNGTLTTRVVMFSNELIKFQDDSGALPSRFITWRMEQSFYGREDLALTDKLLVEQPGILNLALEALDRLRARDRFIQPASGAEMSEELEGLASNLPAFVSECCLIGWEHEALVSSLYQRWQVWCAERGVRWAWEQNHFSQKLRAQVHTIRSGRPRKGGPGRPTTLIGIKLRKG